MNPRPHNPAARAENGTVLIMVMWIVFGLVSIALYFAHSMSLELRASDNRVAAIQAGQAIDGARRYVSLVLSNLNLPGTLPDPQTYSCEAVPVGDAHFWLIGRGTDTNSPTTAHFGLIDEASKININNANSNMLALLPRMTTDLAASIIAWRSTNTTSAMGGAESSTYMNLNPPYLCKNAPFESVDELRLVYNMDMTTLYGEDANLNGILDPNENDGDATPPSDNQDGNLDSGILEYVTVYTHEPNTTTNGTARINVSTINYATGQGMGGLGTLLQSVVPGAVGQITNALASYASAHTIQSPLEFYYVIKNYMTADQFAQIESSLRGVRIQGLINVNTASAPVLACLPGLDNGQAGQVITYRQSNTNNTSGSVAWVAQVLGQSDAAAAGPWLTGRGYQYTADIAALGANGRGYRRTQFVFDTSQGTPIVLHRQDLSNLGWALGKQVRDKWLLAKQTP